MKIGILSDTHGIFREDWLQELNACDHIIHAGDINTKSCYEKFQALSIPCSFVRGNCDHGEWAMSLPTFLSIELGGRTFYVAHQKADFPFDLTDADFLIFGHTHQYSCYDRFGKVFLNPGSAAQARYDSNSLAILELKKDSYEIRRVIL